MSPIAGSVPVAFGLGSNLGDSLAQVRRGVEALRDFVDGVRASSAYRGPPEGGADQPDYVNVVAVGETRLKPMEVLARMREVERAAGRTRPFPGAPRILDVDLLFYGREILRGEDLTVPHPRWEGRPFVVIPLAEVAPEWEDPVSGRSAREVAAAKGWGGPGGAGAAGLRKVETP
ncbi:MAG: 2-amino-4-hydroxy-6-hydroxymethyldihydropteridine diphosphokinase [Gemmatimonadota bacterium]